MRLITQYELEVYTEVELHLIFNKVLSELSRHPDLAHEHAVLIASLQNIDREIVRRKNHKPKMSY